MKLASDCSASGISLRMSKSLLEIPGRSFYSQPVETPAVSVQKPSSFALRINCSGIQLMETNSEVVGKIQNA